MSNLNPYLELMKEELIDVCSKADPSISALHVLKKGDFEKMTRVIQSALEKSTLLSTKQQVEIGTTISVSTLERIFKYGYVPNSNDQRVINTLNKLALFLNYSDWDAYIQDKKKHFNIGGHTFEEVLESVVRNADQAEFEAYQALPNIRTDELKRYLTENGTAFKRINNIQNLHSQKGWTIGNEGNPSGYRIYKLWIENISSKHVTIKTEEYWYLRWFEVATARYRHIYNEENTQTWTLQFDGNLWKVVGTYYPGPRNSIHIKHYIFLHLPPFLQKIIVSSIRSK